MEPNETASKNQRRSVKWEAVEYLHTDKSPDWYWTLGIIALCSAVAAILFNNVLFAILIIISAGVAGLYASRHPNEVVFEISTKGIRADDAFFPYSSLDAFWIDDEDPDDDIPPRLLIRKRKIMMPLIVIPMTLEVPTTEVQSILSQNLTEARLEEPLGHQLLARLGL